MKDTYNLLADSIRQLLRALAQAEGVEWAVWAAEREYERYLASSIKGEAEVDWDSEESRNAFLAGIVSHGHRLLQLAEEALASLAEGAVGRERGAGLLRQLISQDVEQVDDGRARLKEGVARDRIVSLHDPEMRHGRKSSAKWFDGHKAAIAVDAESQLITAVDVLAGNAGDSEGALELTRASEENTGLEVRETIGDCAYGSGSTRQAFADEGRQLVAKVSGPGRRGQIAKEAFEIDLEQMTCTCPAGQTTPTLIKAGRQTDGNGTKHQKRAFLFAADVSGACARRLECVRAKKPRGRTIQLHPQERLLQEAREFQDSAAVQEHSQIRQAAEHLLARLVQLGIRQARYFGRRKTLGQFLLTATVANLTLVANKTEDRVAQDTPPFSSSSTILGLGRSIWTHLSHLELNSSLLGGLKPASRPSFWCFPPRYGLDLR